MNRRPRKNFRARCEQLEDRSLLSMLTPAQVRQAYGMNAIEFSANGQTIQGTGAGQTIAIVGAIHNPFVSGELARLRCRVRAVQSGIGPGGHGRSTDKRLAGPRKRRWMSNGAT